MSENLIDMNKFRLKKVEQEDRDAEEWKQFMVLQLRDLIERVEAGETSRLAILEMSDETGKFRTHMLGFSDYDSYTAIGILEDFKNRIMSSLYEDE